MKQILSLCLTPFILFVSTANILFLGNQVDLEYNLAVYLPFFAVFICAVLLARYIYVHADKNSLFMRSLLWFFYLTGPFYTLFSVQNKYRFIRITGIESLFAVFILLLIVTLLLTIIKVDPFKKAGFFASLFFVILISETVAFATSFDLTRLGNKRYKGFEPEIASLEPDKTAKIKPNIYHLILDGFQTDLFEKYLDQDTKDELGGFILFYKNAALFRDTAFSIPSVFYGTNYDYSTSQVEYRKLSDKKGTLSLLKQGGYITYGFQCAHNIFTYNFDHSLIFEDYKYTDVNDTMNTFGTFTSLWVRAFFLWDKRVLTNEDAVIKSVYGFRHYIQKEALLSANNRYTYFHLLFPHPPFIMDENAMFTRRVTLRPFEDKYKYEQVRGSIRVLIEFLNNLKKTGRYNDSLIIVHADHGLEITDIPSNHYEDKQNDPELNELLNKYYSRDLNIERSRSRALLLVKPAGISSARAFQISEFPTTLLDIAPTILETACADNATKMDGISLLNYDPSIKRIRYFHTSKHMAPDISWTDQLVRFTISDEGIFALDKIIDLKNNPKPRS